MKCLVSVHRTTMTMTERTPDPAHRKAILRAFKAQQRAAAAAALPLPRGDLAALFDHLDAELSEAGCDDTLRRTTCFLAQRGLDVERVTGWLRGAGGYCDCEVLANVEGQWEDHP